MSKEAEIDLSSGLGLACRLAVEVLESADTDAATVEGFRKELLDALSRLSADEAIRLRGELAEGIEELTIGGRFQGWRNRYDADRLSSDRFFW